ncbi:MAG: hypothetical protein IJ009_00320 [Clostridia bacterium]|nr:hypothetical protein [Clostridia bacterium]
MSILQCCAACILVACLGYILRGVGSRGAAAVSLAGGVLILSIALPKYAQPIVALLEMAESAGLSEELSVVLRILFLGLLGSIAADICRDMGEGSVAERLELLIRAEILLLALPFLLEVFRLAFEVVA